MYIFRFDIEIWKILIIKKSRQTELRKPAFDFFKNREKAGFSARFLAGLETLGTPNRLSARGRLYFYPNFDHLAVLSIISYFNL